MKILNIDQSTKISGWSLWENDTMLDYGIVSSEITENNPIARMKVMSEKLAKLIDTVEPDFVVLEQVQFQKNYRTYSQLSQLQGVIFTLLFERDLGFCLIEATAWKAFSNIKGQGRVEQKAATIQMVKTKFGIDVSEDIADAIGIGIWSSKNVTNKN